MKTYVLVLLFLVIVAGSVHALAVTPAFIELDFVPDTTENLTLKIINNAESQLDARVTLEGEMKEYLKLSDPKDELLSIPPYGTSNINIIVRLPHTVERAGKRTASIVITDVSSVPGTVAILTGINVPVSINVPYPGKYAELQLSTVDIAEQEEPVFEITIKNLGEEFIRQLTAHIEVHEGETMIETLRSTAKTSSPHTTEKIRIKSKRPYQSGMYAVMAYAQYDGKKTARESTTLRVGRLFVNITEYTKELEQGKIQKFVLKLKNLWNNPTKDVAADIKLRSPDNEVKDTVKSPTETLPPWGEGELTVFIDTTNLTAGVYTAEVLLTYEGTSRTEYLPVTIKEKTLAPPTKESPRVMSAYIVSIIIVSVIVLNIIFLSIMRRRRHKELSEFKETLDREM